MSAKQRIAYIDIYKGIGIILMIMGHIGLRENYDLYIHAFHMPMFFFISGFLFKCVEFKEFVKRKAVSLLVPYLQFGIFNFIMCLIIAPDYKIGRYFEIMFFFNNKGLPIGAAIWFLTCLFFVNVLFYIAIKYFKKYYLHLFIILLVAILYFTKIRLPLSLDSAIYVLPIFYFGFLFKDLIDKNHLDNKIQITAGIFILILFSYLLFENDYVNVMDNVYGNIFLFYINATGMSIGIFYLAKLLEIFKSSQIFNYVGRNSLNFMCLNQIIIYFISDKFNVHNKIMILILAMISLTIINEILIFPYFSKIFTRNKKQERK